MVLIPPERTNCRLVSLLIFATICDCRLSIGIAINELVAVAVFDKCRRLAIAIGDGFFDAIDARRRLRIAILRSRTNIRATSSLRCIVDPFVLRDSANELSALVLARLARIARIACYFARAQIDLGVWFCQSTNELSALVLARLARVACSSCNFARAQVGHWRRRWIVRRRRRIVVATRRHRKQRRNCH